MDFPEFSTDMYPQAGRAAAWRDALQCLGLRLATEGVWIGEPGAAGSGAGPSLYGAIVRHRTDSGIELARLSASPQTWHGLPATAAGPGALSLLLMLDGQATVEQRGQLEAVLAGDVLCWPSSTQFGLRLDADLRALLIRLPLELLATRLGGDPLPKLRRLRTGDAIGQVLAGFACAIADTIDRLDEGALQPIELALLELVLANLANERDTEPATTLSASQAALLQRLCQKIEARLSDEALSAARLATEEHLSERYVHKLFESSGQSFSRYLRSRRLERCRSDLGNPMYSHLSISDICFRWGFNDSAHFSHAFRDRFGVSPRAYRHESAAELSGRLLRQVSRGWPSGTSDAPRRRGGSRTDGTTASAGAPAPSDEVRSHREDASDTDGANTARPSRRHPDPASPGEPRQHHVPANARTVHWGYFSRDLRPVLQIASGDIVTIETLTQHANDDRERMVTGDPGAESVFHWTPGQKNVDRRGAGPMDASIYGRGSGEGFGVHICTGPIDVRGARPGDVLEVRILDIRPRLCANPIHAGRVFGSNAATWWGYHYRDLIEEPKPREVVTIYELDTTRGDEQVMRAVYNFRWTPQRDPCGVLHPTIDYPGVPVDHTSIQKQFGVLPGVRIPVRAHFGVMGVAPREAGVVDSIPPAYFGGNIDNWRVTKGASVYFPVNVAGALFSVGDPHASQGDSELCGTAIECSLTGVFQLIVHPRERLAGQVYEDLGCPLIETPSEWVLHGFSHPNYLTELGERAQSEIYRNPSLDLAMRDAFRKTRRFLMGTRGLTEDEAISLMSVAADFGVTQVVDGNLGVHAVIRRALFDDQA